MRNANTKNRITTVLTLAAVMMAVIVFANTSASAAPLSATGWNVDFILGNGEAYAAHQKPENPNIWFAEDSTVGILGLPASGAVTAAGVDYQLQPYTGATNNVLRGSGTLTLDSPGKFTEISVLGSNTGAASNLDWELTLNFSDAASAGPITYDNFTNWAGGTSDVLPNPQLTSNGTSSGFVGTLTTRSIDLDALGHSGKTLQSIDFSATNQAGGNLAVFGLAGVAAPSAIPEPTSLAIALLGVVGMGCFCWRRRKSA